MGKTTLEQILVVGNLDVHKTSYLQIVFCCCDGYSGRSNNDKAAICATGKNLN
jgi:hypothetical protein